MDTQQQLNQASPAEIHTIRHGFEVGSYHLLIAPQTRAEVVKSPAVCPLPGTPDWFIGVMNHRGEAVPVYDLDKYLEIIEEPVQAKRWVLLIDTQPNTVGVILQAPPLSVIDPDRLCEPVGDLPEVFKTAVNDLYQRDGVQWLEMDHQQLFLALKKQF